MDAQETTYESTQEPFADPGALLGLLSLLGGSDASEPSADDGPDRASALLSALKPYLRDTRVLSVDRVIRLLETARGVRGLLHSAGPILGDFLGGKS